MISIKGFTKRYDGLLAVDDLSLTIEKGEICGFIGPNGAGKTTTMRFLSTLLRPTYGSAEINGYDVVRQVSDVRRSIGFMPDSFGIYDGMKVWEYLDFFGTAYNLPASERKRIIGDVLPLLDLQGKAESDVSMLSRGMKQRLALARTLVHDPPVLILDEPASGLDPRARLEIKELLRELQSMGKTILISSHILSELSDLCTQLAIIERGKLVAAGGIDDILKKAHEHWQIEIEVLGMADEAERALLLHGLVRKVERLENRIEFGFEGTREELASLTGGLVRSGIPLLWCKERDVSLELAFMSITKGDVS